MRLMTQEQIERCRSIGRDEESRRSIIGLAELDALCKTAEAGLKAIDLLQQAKLVMDRPCNTTCYWCLGFNDHNPHCPLLDFLGSNLPASCGQCECCGKIAERIAHCGYCIHCCQKWHKPAK